MRGLRRLLLATVSVATLSSTALAADLPARMPIKAAPPAMMAWSWAGPYIGINLGVAWNRAEFTDLGDDGSTAYAFAPGTTFWTPNKAGFTGGGQLGYNFQAGNFVYGLEADLNWANNKATVTFPGSTAATKLNWMATVRGRLGLALSSPTLIYVTGGLALAEFRDTFGWLSTPNHFDSKNTRAGWTVGGGIEHMLTRNWTAKIEALYSDFGSWTLAGPAGVVGPYRSRFAHEVVTVRGGLNWKW